MPTHCNLLPPQQASKNKVVASGTYVPPKTMSRQVAEAKALKTQVASSSGIYVPPSNGTGPVVGMWMREGVCVYNYVFISLSLSEVSRKRKLEGASGRLFG